MSIPVAIITSMAPLAHLVGAQRIVMGVSIPYTCGDPNLPPQEDYELRKEIVRTALKALQTEVKEPTIFYPKMDTSTTTT